MTVLEKFLHFNATSVKDAVALLKKYEKKAKVIAGGTDLVGRLYQRLATPEVLVNIKTIPDLSYIKEDAEGLKIGATTTLTEIVKSSIVKAKYDVLAQAASKVGSPQLRNMGTLGGNLIQEVRCWYYRAGKYPLFEFFCYRKGGTICYAVAGDNRYNAILEGKVCFAVCPSDTAIPLVALNAKAKIVGTEGERVVPLEEFYVTLGNVLKSDEILTEIQIPAPKPNTKGAFRKAMIRGGLDFGVASAAVVGTIVGGIISDSRVVLGNVAPTPYRAKAAETALNGKSISESIAVSVANEALKDAVPLSMNAYKVHIAKGVVKQAILSLV